MPPLKKEDALYGLRHQAPRYPVSWRLSYGSTSIHGPIDWGWIFIIYYFKISLRCLTCLAPCCRVVLTIELNWIELFSDWIELFCLFWLNWQAGGLRGVRGLPFWPVPTFLGNSIIIKNLFAVLLFHMNEQPSKKPRLPSNGQRGKKNEELHSHYKDIGDDRVHCIPCYEKWWMWRMGENLNEWGRLQGSCFREGGCRQTKKNANHALFDCLPKWREWIICIGCNAHGWKLALKDIFQKVQLVRVAMAATDRILRVFERNPNVKEILKNAQKSPLSLIYWGETRWNTKIDAMMRVAHLSSAINFVMEETVHEYKLKDEEIRKSSWIPQAVLRGNRKIAAGRRHARWCFSTGSFVGMTIRVANRLSVSEYHLWRRTMLNCDHPPMLGTLFRTAQRENPCRNIYFYLWSGSSSSDGRGRKKRFQRPPSGGKPTPSITSAGPLA